MNGKAKVAVIAACVLAGCAGALAAWRILGGKSSSKRPFGREYVAYDYESAVKKAKERLNAEGSDGGAVLVPTAGEKADYGAIAKKYASVKDDTEFDTSSIEVRHVNVWDFNEHEPVPESDENREHIFGTLRMPPRVLDPDLVGKRLPDTVSGKRVRITEEQFRYEGAYNDKKRGRWFHEDCVLAGWDGALEESDDIEMARRCWTAVEDSPTIRAVYFRDADRGIDYEVTVSSEDWVNAWCLAHIEELE